MILLVLIAIAAGMVPLARGRLSNFAQLRFRRGWLLAIAVLLQLGLAFIDGPRSGARDIIHIASYGFAITFLLMNRHTPGMWLIGAGAAMNLAAILANGGVMPASPHALAAAGLPIDTVFHHFANSMALPSPKLAFLGDIFAIPKSLPLSNVFSAGDVCIVLGACVTLHRVSGSRLLPSGRGQFRPLFQNRTFMRLWGSQAVSNLGDWTYAVAVAFTLLNRTHSPKLLSLLLICQVAPAALFGGLLGALADRHSRVKLMIGADVIRAIAVASLLVGHPSIGHIYVVAATLGVCGAVFQPSLQASIPNVVKDGELVAANSMVGATFYFAIMAGPALGGALSATKVGPSAVFAINALSFVISIALIAGVRLPRPSGEAREHTAMRDLVEGAKYAIKTPLVRGLLIVVGLVLVAAASKAPLESLFVLSTLSLGPEALGLVLGCWGLGMLLGSIASPAICRKWARERVLVVTIAVVGVCVLAASQANDIETVLLAWLVAGGANSIANVSYESLLQERTPDEFRGRVFAAFELITNVGFLVGAFLAGWLGTQLGIRLSYVFSGSLFVLAAVVARVVLPRVRSARAVLVGFDSSAAQEAADVRRIDIPLPPVAPVPLPVAAEPQRDVAVEREPDVAATMASMEPTAVFNTPNSVFSGSESVFAMAERESGFDPNMPDAGLPQRSSAEEPLVFRPAAPAEPEPAETWPAPELGDLGDLLEPEVDATAPDDPFELDVDPTVPDDPSELISSFDPEDRLRAVELAARATDDPLETTIMKALADPSPQVRRRAAIELGRLQLVEAIPALDHAIDDPDDSVRTAAVEALGEMDDDATLESVVRALRDPSKDVRQAAISVLLADGSDSIVEVLCRSLASHPLRQAAGDMLSRLGGADRFAEELSVPDPAVRRRAVEALGAMGSPATVQPLLRALIDPVPDVRARAAELLGRLGDPIARDDLDRTCYDPVPEVGEAARNALAQLDQASSPEPALL
jgi:HEAT repeat protein/MFS family permease